MANEDATRLVDCLEMQEHPGVASLYFKEVFKSDLEVRVVGGDVKHDCKGQRNAVSSIYTLIKGDSYVSWRKNHSDSLFFYHRGGNLRIHEITPEGEYKCSLLGDPTRTSAEATFQVHMRSGHWYAKELVDKQSFILYGDVIVPGFEFRDLHEGSRKELIDLFPKHTDMIQRFTAED